MKKILIGLVALAMLAAVTQSDAKLYNVNVTGDASYQYVAIGGVLYQVKGSITTATLLAEVFKVVGPGLPNPITLSKTVLVLDTATRVVWLAAKDSTTPGYTQGQLLVAVWAFPINFASLTFQDAVHQAAGAPTAARLFTGNAWALPFGPIAGNSDLSATATWGTALPFELTSFHVTKQSWVGVYRHAITAAPGFVIGPAGLTITTGSELVPL
jgi:hypothetical protein